MYRSTMNEVTLYSPTNGVKPQLVTDFRHVVMMVNVTTAGAAATALKFRASAQRRLPDFNGAVTQTNFHAPVQVKNLSDGTTINGGIGIPVDVLGMYLVEVNTNLISWIAADITAAGAAVFTIDLIASGD